MVVLVAGLVEDKIGKRDPEKQTAGQRVSSPCPTTKATIKNRIEADPILPTRDGWHHAQIQWLKLFLAWVGRPCPTTL